MTKDTGPSSTHGTQRATAKRGVHSCSSPLLKTPPSLNSSLSNQGLPVVAKTKVLQQEQFHAAIGVKSEPCDSWVQCALGGQTASQNLCDVELSRAPRCGSGLNCRLEGPLHPPIATGGPPSLKPQPSPPHPHPPSSLLFAMLREGAARAGGGGGGVWAR